MLQRAAAEAAASEQAARAGSEAALAPAAPPVALGDRPNRLGMRPSHLAASLQVYDHPDRPPARCCHSGPGACFTPFHYLFRWKHPECTREIARFCFFR